MPQLHHDRYLRSNSYDPEWVVENEMGPNALWLLESLCDVLPLEPGQRVLDLGCGRAMTSIFLAREFGVEVVAADLWIPAEENRVRIAEAGVADRVTAVHAEAHQLPFEPESFDRFAGRYEMEEVAGFIVEFTREDEAFFVQATGQPKLTLVPTSATSFTIEGVPASVTFHAEGDGAVFPGCGPTIEAGCRRQRERASTSSLPPVRVACPSPAA